MASGEDPRLRGLLGQPLGVRGGRVGGRVGVLIRGQRDRAAQERHARHLQFRCQGFRCALESFGSTVNVLSFS